MENALKNSAVVAHAQDLTVIIKGLQVVEVGDKASCAETTVGSIEAHEQLYPEHHCVAPERHDDVPLDRETEEPKGGRTQRRRLKQRERRQRWRSEKRKEKSEEEVEIVSENEQSTVASPLEPSSPGENTLFSHTTSKRHRPSPQERTMSFFAKFYEGDTRPADWALVGGGHGDDYARFPYQCVDPPLSRLSMLVREVEDAIKMLGSLSCGDVPALERLVDAKASQLTFLRKHLRHVNGLRKVMVRHMGKHGFDSIEDAFKKSWYGHLVLSRVIPQLENYHLELSRRLRIWKGEREVNMVS